MITTLSWSKLLFSIRQDQCSVLVKINSVLVKILRSLGHNHYSASVKITTLSWLQSQLCLGKDTALLRHNHCSALVKVTALPWSRLQPSLGPISHLCVLFLSTTSIARSSEEWGRTGQEMGALLIFKLSFHYNLCHHHQAHSYVNALPVIICSMGGVSQAVEITRSGHLEHQRSWEAAAQTELYWK